MIIAVAALGTGIAFEYAGLGGAANLATIVALLSQLAAVVGWAKARDERRRPSEVLTEALRALGEFLRRCVADGPGGIDNPQLISRWSAGQIAVYTSGKAFPPENFVADCLEVSAAESRPAVSGGMVYVGSWTSKGGSVCALDATTGGTSWCRTMGRVEHSGPAVAAETVYVGSWDDKLHALDAITGKPLWSFTTGDPVDSSPVVVGGIIYVGSQDGKLYAIDAATHKSRWAYSTGGYVSGTPAVANGSVYFGSYNHQVYAISAASGQFLWSRLTGDQVESGPTAANGTIYAGSDDGKVYAINASTGP